VSFLGYLNPKLGVALGPVGDGIIKLIRMRVLDGVESNDPLNTLRERRREHEATSGNGGRIAITPKGPIERDDRDAESAALYAARKEVVRRLELAGQRTGTSSQKLLRAFLAE